MKLSLIALAARLCCLETRRLFLIAQRNAQRGKTVFRVPSP